MSICTHLQRDLHHMEHTQVGMISQDTLCAHILTWCMLRLSRMEHNNSNCNSSINSSNKWFRSLPNKNNKEIILMIVTIVRVIITVFMNNNKITISLHLLLKINSNQMLQIRHSRYLNKKTLLNNNLLNNKNNSNKKLNQINQRIIK